MMTSTMNCPDQHILKLKPIAGEVAYRYAVISDVHLGHRKTPAAETISKLDYYLSDSLFEQIDILVIAGDLYDSLLDLNQDETHDIDYWIFRMLLKAKKYNVMVWILEGTPLHDREQSKRIITFNEGAELQTDARYFDKITIHYEPKLDRHFLFVPDEATDSPAETLAEVRRQMKEHGLKQVDCGFMHGAFKYQLPDMDSIPTHDEASYLEIVKYTISIGHVHEATSFDRIHAQGSFDRLGHGTELAKGFNVVTIYEDGSHDVTFVENKEAKIYKTILLQSSEVEDGLSEIDEAVKDAPEGSHMRLRAPEKHPLLGSMDVVMRRHPGFYWISKADKVDRAAKEASAQTRYVPIILNAQTLGKQVMDALQGRPELEERHLNKAKAFFNLST
jgi:UDP-2,3-diacylglucosamine pyrophosphatase LpxH